MAAFDSSGAAENGVSVPHSRHKAEAGALKRKLDALGYTNQDEASYTPLVRRIVDDLIYTTDCYLSLKQQASSGIQHVNHVSDKACSKLSTYCVDS